MLGRQIALGLNVRERRGEAQEGRKEVVGEGEGDAHCERLDAHPGGPRSQNRTTCPSSHYPWTIVKISAKSDPSVINHSEGRRE